MEPLHALLLLGISALAGAVNALAGGGTFFTFPVLIFLGLTPHLANTTNSVGIWVASLASVRGYRSELRLPRALLIRLALAAFVGSIAGSLALLATSNELFSDMVPYLMLMAATLFAFGPALRRAASHLLPPREERQFGEGVGGMLGQGAIGFYGGFFGAGMGILMMALYQMMGLKNLHEVNSIKTIMATAINAVSVTLFIVAGAVAWPHAIVMTVGGAIGGFLGAHYGKRINSELLRWLVIAYSFAMTGYFFFIA